MNKLLILFFIIFLVPACSTSITDAVNIPYRSPPPPESYLNSNLWKAIVVPSAKYPRRALSRGIEGWVIVSYDIYWTEVSTVLWS